MIMVVGRYFRKVDAAEDLHFHALNIQIQDLRGTAQLFYEVVDRHGLHGNGFQHPHCRIGTEHLGNISRSRKPVGTEHMEIQRFAGNRTDAGVDDLIFRSCPPQFLCQLRIGMEQPSSLGNAVCFVIEFFGIQLIKIMQLLLFSEFPYAVPLPR